MRGNWFFETFYSDFMMALAVEKTLHSGKSKFQEMLLLETSPFGKVLVLDNAIQTTTRDEFIYHEAITHVPMCAHPFPKDVLIIGGGDGGVLREVLRHKTVEKVTMVEIDSKVIEFCQRYLPEICKNAFDSEKLDLQIQDGAKFIKDKENAYDVIIVDSPDPIGPAKVLFAEEFYRDLHRCVKTGGVFVRQSGSAIFQKEELKQCWEMAGNFFKYAGVYTAAIPAYIGGLYSFCFASDAIDPEKFDRETIEQRSSKIANLRYYNPAVHLASFALPNYIRHTLDEG